MIARSSLIELNPMLYHYLSDFLSTQQEPQSAVYQDMDTVGTDGKPSADTTCLSKMILVCANKINLVLTNSIHWNEGLIGADNVRLEAPKIILEGSPDNPIQILANSLTIKSTDLKIQNATLYFFNDPQKEECRCHLTSTSGIADVTNVRMISLMMEDEEIRENLICHIRNKNDFKKWLGSNS